MLGVGAQYQDGQWPVQVPNARMPVPSESAPYRDMWSPVGVFSMELPSACCVCPVLAWPVPSGSAWCPVWVPGMGMPSTQ